MRRTLPVSILATVALTASPPAAPQDLESGENVEQVWFVPRMVGAVSIDAGIQTPFGVGASSGYPTTWSLSLGWRHFLEGHGRVSVRPFAIFERGGLLHPSFEGRSLRFGGGLSFTVRGISRDWVFGTLSILGDASVLSFEPPARPFAAEETEPVGGSQFGVGLESTFGSLFVLDPYLFTETGASATISRVQLGSVDAWEVWGRWTLRFEWAITGGD